MPPITTISPSAIKSLVAISILLIPGSPETALFTESLFTWTSNRTFPSPIMLGVTVNFSAASLNEVLAPSAPVAWNCISSPCVIVATWLSNVKTFGLDIVFPSPKDSKAWISAFKTAEPVLFKIPIPLVAPAALVVKSVTVSAVPPIAALPSVIAVFAVELAPAIPPTDSWPLWYAPPNLVPSALSKSESASTINASIKTCFVRTSISPIILSTTSKSSLFPLTIIDLVVTSSVICIGLKEDSPDEANNSVMVVLACAGDI